jgi:hypothetical protein
MRLRSTSMACESARSHFGSACGAVGVRREQDVRVHLDEERRAALQIQAELDLAGRVALKPVQDEQIRVNLVLRAGMNGKYFCRSFVPAASCSAVNSLVPAFCSAACARMFVNVASGFLRAAGKLLHQIARGRRINFIQRPG